MKKVIGTNGVVIAIFVLAIWLGVSALSDQAVGNQGEKKVQEEEEESQDLITKEPKNKSKDSDEKEIKALDDEEKPVKLMATNNAEVVSKDSLLTKKADNKKEVTVKETKNIQSAGAKENKTKNGKSSNANNNKAANRAEKKKVAVKPVQKSVNSNHTINKRNGNLSNKNKESTQKKSKASKSSVSDDPDTNTQPETSIKPGDKEDIGNTGSSESKPSTPTKPNISNLPTGPANPDEPEDVITHKNKVVEKTIPYNTIKKEDQTLKVGETLVKTEGVNGKKVITYKVTFTNNEESNRKEIGREITESIDEVILVGTGAYQIEKPEDTIETKK